MNLIVFGIDKEYIFLWNDINLRVVKTIFLENLSRLKRSGLFENEKEWTKKIEKLQRLSKIKMNGKSR